MRKQSFTLIEVLVVITIVGLLAGIGAVSYSQFGKQSRDAKRKADLEQIRAALEQHRSTNDTYINTADLDCAGDGITSSGDLSSLTSIPKDPKCPAYTYAITDVAASDYTVGAFLENPPSSSCSITFSCSGSGGTVNCNYCIGPYGEK